MSMNINDNIPTVAVICGPTATGKTRLSVELARSFDGEIVSADSMQIYRRMDIGTAKATAGERAAAVHHMLDVADPAENWSVARYVEEATRCCDDIIARGRLPIVVGGTGLYIDSLISGLDFADNTSDNALRDKLSAEYDSLGGDAMLARLAQFDPERAAKLHSGDKRRIVRAIEIYLLTGTTITEHDRITAARPKRYDAARIVLNYADRADLYARIDARVDAMEQAGLVDEVRALLASGLSPDCTAMQAIGYKEIAAFLEGKTTEREAFDLIKQSSRRYAKRQLTWFGRWQGALRIVWDKVPDMEKARHASTEFLHCRVYHNAGHPDDGCNTL